MYFFVLQISFFHPHQFIGYNDKCEWLQQLVVWKQMTNVLDGLMKRANTIPGSYRNTQADQIFILNFDESKAGINSLPTHRAV